MVVQGWVLQETFVSFPTSLKENEGGRFRKNVRRWSVSWRGMQFHEIAVAVMNSAAVITFISLSITLANNPSGIGKAYQGSTPPWGTTGRITVEGGSVTFLNDITTDKLPLAQEPCPPPPMLRCDFKTQPCLQRHKDELLFNVGHYFHKLSTGHKIQVSNSEDICISFCSLVPNLRLNFFRTFRTQILKVK